MNAPLRSVFFAAALLAAPAPAPAAAWEPAGMAGIATTAIEYDPVHRRLLVATLEGFHVLELSTGEWAEHDEEGWIGRTVSSIAWHATVTDRVITGRTNAFFKGYVEVSDSLDENGTVAYSSQGGSVNGIARHLTNPDRFFACTWEDVSPGEFLRSSDGGLSWAKVTGTGQFTMTGVTVDDAGYVYLAGDAPLTRSTNGGGTWAAASGGLPAGLGCYFVEAARTAAASTAYTSNDAALYVSTDRGVSWTSELAASCRNLDLAEDGATTSAVTAAVAAWDGRVLFSEGVGAGWTDETGDLAATPVDLVFAEDYVWVATAADGVYRTDVGLALVGVEVAPAPQKLRLLAAPNPFRERTTLTFALPEAGDVRIDVFDVAGRRVGTALDAHRAAGVHRIDWSAADLPGGVYFVRLTGAGGAANRRIVVQQ